MNALELRDVTYRYGRREVLRGVDLTVPWGSVTALAGANGAGKTTLLRVIAAELRPRAGRVSVLGRAPRKSRAELGWVPDHVPLPRWMRVRDHLRLLEPFYPTWSRAEERRLAQLLEVDVDRRVSELSKGQRQLASLLAALAHQPRLLLLDEPFSGLDVAARDRVLRGVLDHVSGERAALVASHAFVDLERAADRIAVLDGGRVTLCGPLEEHLEPGTGLEHLFPHPQSESEPCAA